MLESTCRIRLPQGWLPSMPFPPVRVHYLPADRSPDELWITPYLVDETGRVVQYLAAGPAGKPFADRMVTHVETPDAPGDVRIDVVAGRDWSGQVVYGSPSHTMN